MEIFKDIIDYEGVYQISNYGNVKSLQKLGNNGGIRRERILNIWKHKSGYMCIDLHNNKQGKTYRVHRLVALHFILNPENKSQVNHIDGVKTNNHVENLEWCTASENIKHAFKLGLMDNRGENHPGHILSNIQVQEIKQLLANGFLQKDIAKLYSVHRTTIGDIKRNKSRKEF